MTMLIIGLGNAGRRHARNAIALGAEVIGYDVRPVPMAGVVRVSSLAQGLALRPDAAVVATPPEDHFKTVLECLGARIPTLVEKPLATNLADGHVLHALANKLDVRLAVAYQLRFHDGLRAMRDELRRQRGCPVRGVIACYAAMKDWPPCTYSRDVLMEFSHELDLLCFLFDATLSVKVMPLSRSQNDWTKYHLFVESTDRCYKVDLWLDSAPIMVCRYVRLYIAVQAWSWDFEEAANEAAYRLELEAFLAGGHLSDGLGALRLVEAARLSAVTGKWEEA